MHRIEEELKEEELREEASPPPPPIFTQKRVKMELNKWESLIKDFGLPLVNKMLDRLDEYADINPKRFKQYACHAAVIRKWIRDDKEKGFVGVKNLPLPAHGVGEKTAGEIEGDNRNWSTQMRPILWPYTRVDGGQKLDMFSNRWEFRLKDGTIKVYFNDKDFIEKCKKYLKELGIMV